MAGRFMELGERSACAYTKGESTMIGLVNAKGRVSRQRAASLRRAGRAVYRFPSFHEALLARKITLAHVDLMSKWAKKPNSGQVRDAEEASAAVAVLSTPEEFEDALRTWVAVADPHEHLVARSTKYLSTPSQASWVKPAPGDPPISGQSRSCALSTQPGPEPH